MVNMMKRWAQSALGRSNLDLTQVPIPEPGAHEVLVKTSAVSLNYRDKVILESGMGLDIAYPFTPCSDLAGEVVDTGSAVTRFATGARVLSTFNPYWTDGDRLTSGRTPLYNTVGGYYPGILSEYVVVHEENLVAAPKSLTDEEASTLAITGLTAWWALVEKGALKAGQTVVAQGTGGVSLFAAQIAAAHGARVLLTSSSDEKLERAAALAPIEGINRSRQNWADAALDLTDGRGADQILEMAGGANLEKAVAAAKPNGFIHLVGIFEGLEVSAPIFPILLKQVTIQGVCVGHRRAFEDLIRAVDHVKLKPVIDAVYPFEDFGEALDHLERGPFGKIVLRVG